MAIVMKMGSFKLETKCDIEELVAPLAAYALGPGYPKLDLSQTCFGPGSCLGF